MGADSLIYLQTNRRPPGRYFYLYPLYTRGYQNAERVQEFLADLEAFPPRVIVDASSAAFQYVPPLDRELRLLWSPADTSYMALPEMDEVLAFIQANYVQVGLIGPSAWAVYSHR